MEALSLPSTLFAPGDDELSATGFGCDFRSHLPRVSASASFPH